MKFSFRGKVNGSTNKQYLVGMRQINTEVISWDRYDSE